MGTGERSIASAKRSKIPTSAAPPANPPPSPPPAHSDRPISVQAVYSGAAAAASAALPVFYPPLAVSSIYPGGSQYPYPSYGIPIAYAPMYPYGGIYTQPVLATGLVYIDLKNSAERRLAEKKSKEESWNGGDGMKAASDPVNEDGSQSDIEGEGSSSTGLQDYFATEKKNIGETLRDGGSMQHIGSTQYDNTTAESSSSAKRPATKLSVSASGREALHGPTSMLAAESLSVIAEQKGLLPEHHCLLDELKKQRRKQSNREAARRSRLRKQQEYENLARRVDVLKSENNALRMEIEQLARENKELDSENASIAEELNKIFSQKP